MPSAEKEDLSRAILRYLSSVGVHVRPAKLSPSQGKTASVAARRLFGVPLHSLPLSAQADGVPQFLVDACALLRQHLHVEGLFRKTGSVIRINALKTRLEAGENCLHMALPCDVATLVKQFLRNLPEPLIPAELQGPLCQIQQRPEEDREPLTLLLTCLVPPGSASTLSYFFSFLQDVAARCSQNKMDLANLAVVFAPNLFPSEPCGKLGGGTEQLLQTQAAVVELLITRALEIGVIPHSLLGKVEAALSDMEHKRQFPPGAGHERGQEAESRRKSRRRRSVGDIVTEALSKFKSGRALRPAPCPEIKDGADRVNESSDSSLRTSFNSKRKASDDVGWPPELSVKKRRSALNSECSDSSNEEVFVRPVELDLVQGPGSPALVFSNSPSSPIFGTGSPRIYTAKVQRRRSSGRKQPQRKRSIRTAPSCSPTPFEQKDVGHKSLHVFIRGSKDLCPVSPSIKVVEPIGQLLTKKLAAEVLGALEDPGSQQPGACLPSPKPQVAEERSLGQSPDEESPPYKDQAALNTAVKCKRGTGARPCLDGVTCGKQEPVVEMVECFLGGPAAATPPLRQLRVLRRSLSWPEDLSMRDTAEQEKPDSFPNEAAVIPGDHFGLAEAGQTSVEVTAADMRRADVPTVCVTPAGSCRAVSPEKKPCDIPNSPHSSKPDLPDSHSVRPDSVHHLSKVSRSSLKRFALNFQWTSSQPNDEQNTSRPKWKGGRRFGRSLSHESGLPLRVEEEADCAAKKKGATLLSPKSPLQSFRAYGRQFFITHKHWAMAFVGHRGKKEPPSPSPQETKRALADFQEPLLSSQPEDESHSYRSSAKLTLVEPQLAARQDSPDL